MGAGPRMGCSSSAGHFLGTFLCKQKGTIEKCDHHQPEYFRLQASLTAKNAHEKNNYLLHLPYDIPAGEG